MLKSIFVYHSQDSDIRTCLQSKYITGYTEYGPPAQHAGQLYMIGSGTAMQENQTAAQIATEHNISLGWRHIYVMNLFCAGGNRSPGSLTWDARYS